MSTAVSTPRLAGKSAVILFVFVLLAFVVESQLTQYVQSDLGFRQPYFIFYAVHSSFSIIFFLHLSYLSIRTNRSPRDYLSGLSIAIKRHLSPQTYSTPNPPFPVFKFALLIFFLSIGMTAPALLWFCAVSLAPLSDVTAIWNTNAMFAYGITVKLFRLQWDAKPLFAVILATIGVMAVIYGGASVEPSVDESSIHLPNPQKYPSPLIGDLLTLVASIGYGLYQVLYKRYATLPEDEAPPFYNQLPVSNDSLSSQSSLFGHEATASSKDSAVYPPPFGLHPNLLTSLAGFVILVVLWFPIPILHYTGAEPFRLPTDMTTVLVIAGIGLSGGCFNAGLVTLLGVWGPVVTSIGNLLTIVLIFISDTIFGSGVGSITVWNVAGAGAIVSAFGILAYDLLRTAGET